MFIEFDGMRLAELGRSIMAESVAGGGDETTLNGDRSPSVSEDADMAPCFPKSKSKLPVDDLKGASRAIA